MEAVRPKSNVKEISIIYWPEKDVTMETEIETIGNLRVQVRCLPLKLDRFHTG